MTTVKMLYETIAAIVVLAILIAWGNSPSTDWHDD
jgi:hypothetical protein